MSWNKSALRVNMTLMRAKAGNSVGEGWILKGCPTKQKELHRRHIRAPNTSSARVPGTTTLVKPRRCTLATSDCRCGSRKKMHADAVQLKAAQKTDKYHGPKHRSIIPFLDLQCVGLPQKKLSGPVESPLSRAWVHLIPACEPALQTVNAKLESTEGEKKQGEAIHLFLEYSQKEAIRTSYLVCNGCHNQTWTNDQSYFCMLPLALPCLTSVPLHVVGKQGASVSHQLSNVPWGVARLLGAQSPGLMQTHADGQAACSANKKSNSQTQSIFASTALNMFHLLHCSSHGKCPIPKGVSLFEGPHFCWWFQRKPKNNNTLCFFLGVALNKATHPVTPPLKKRRRKKQHHPLFVGAPLKKRPHPKQHSISFRESDLPAKLIRSDSSNLSRELSKHRTESSQAK